MPELDADVGEHTWLGLHMGRLHAPPWGTWSCGPVHLGSCEDWHRRFWNLQVTDTAEHALQLRPLATAPNPSEALDLRWEIQEKLLDYKNPFCKFGQERLEVNDCELANKTPRRGRRRKVLNY